jgi:hypothetical protein
MISIEDEGTSFEIDLQEQTASGEGERDEGKRTADEASKQIYGWHQKHAPALRQEHSG